MINIRSINWKLEKEMVPFLNNTVTRIPNPALAIIAATEGLKP